MPSAWDVHLKDYRAKHPKLSLKEAMIGASKTYTKKSSSKTSKKKQGSGRLEELKDEKIMEYKNKVGKEAFEKEVKELPDLIYPETEADYSTNVGKILGRTIPLPVIYQKIKEDLPRWKSDQKKDPKYMKEVEKLEKQEAERQKHQKNVDNYNKLTPAQKKESEKAVAKAFTGGLGDEFGFRVAKEAKGYIDKVAPVAGKVADKINPVAGQAFNVAKQATDQIYKILDVPEDLSNEVAGQRIADKVKNAVKKIGGGKKKKRKIRITIKEI
jgi:hypothetical protein